jgi:hypothetical protein
MLVLICSIIAAPLSGCDNINLQQQANTEPTAETRESVETAIPSEHITDPNWVTFESEMSEGYTWRGETGYELGTYTADFDPGGTWWQTSGDMKENIYRYKQFEMFFGLSTSNEAFFSSGTVRLRFTYPVPGTFWDGVEAVGMEGWWMKTSAFKHIFVTFDTTLVGQNALPTNDPTFVTMSFRYNNHTGRLEGQVDGNGFSPILDYLYDFPELRCLNKSFGISTSEPDNSVTETKADNLLLSLIGDWSGTAGRFTDSEDRYFLSLYSYGDVPLHGYTVELRCNDYDYVGIWSMDGYEVLLSLGDSVISFWYNDVAERLEFDNIGETLPGLEDMLFLYRNG